MFTDPQTQKTASWRNMDLPELYFNAMAWVPKGYPINFIPVASKGKSLQYSSMGKNYTTKNSFVCVTSMRPEIEALMNALAPGSKLNKKSSPGVCTDGMNIAGLAVSALMQPSSTGINLYNGTGPAVEQVSADSARLVQFQSYSS